MNESTAHLGGSWPQGDPYTFWPDIWGWLLVEYPIKSVVDIGCGHGQNAKWFIEQGCQAIGIEGDPNALNENVLPHDCILVHDYTKGPLTIPHVDLAIALEFVEHVEQRFEQNWITTVQCSDYFLMCHAVPGQGGHHHVNEQTTEYWVERIEREGFSYYPLVTEKFRSTMRRMASPWGRVTAMFFARGE